MGAQATSVAKIICFVCRRSDCGCLAPKAALGPPQRSELTWAVACLGGACVAGTAVGALLAMLLGAG
jgi:hypothetical protein